MSNFRVLTGHVTSDNVDYNDIKHLIKAHTSKDNTQPQAIAPREHEVKVLGTFEQELFAELKEQHQRIDLFVKSKSGEISRRLSMWPSFSPIVAPGPLFDQRLSTRCISLEIQKLFLPKVTFLYSANCHTAGEAFKHIIFYAQSSCRVLLSSRKTCFAGQRVSSPGADILS